MSTAPSNPEPGPSLARAWQLYRWRRFSQAREETHKFLANHPDSAEAHSLIAQCYGGERKWWEADEAAREAILLAPEWSYPHYVLALVHFWYDDFEGAKGALLEALRLSPEDPELFDLLSAVHAEQGNFDSALETAEQGLSFYAAHAGCHYRRGNALQGLNRFGDAEDAFRTVLRSNAEHSPAQGYLGYFALQRGDFPTAIPLLRSSLRENPDWVFAQKAWQEALCGKYWFYRLAAKLKYILFEKRILATILVIFLGSLLVSKIFISEDPRESMRQSTAGWIVLSCVVTLLFLAILYYSLTLFLGLISRALLMYDAELRRTIDWRRIVVEQRQKIAIVLVIIFVVVVANLKKR